ncbi:hypothetical protein TNCV_3901921 [Trichonephila clavipes]|nr:hypothetical protein TNCV_3901921 [Trichonephila clavipes]
MRGHLPGHDDRCSVLDMCNVTSPSHVTSNGAVHTDVTTRQECPTKDDTLDTMRTDEDFGKRNMPGKRARRHFSQLSEFQRGLIIGVGSSGQEKVPTRGKPGLERPGRPRGERIEGSGGKHLWSPHDSFNDTSRRRRSNCSTNNFQSPCRSKS